MCVKSYLDKIIEFPQQHTIRKQSVIIVAT